MKLFKYISSILFSCLLMVSSSFAMENAPAQQAEPIEAKTTFSLLPLTIAKECKKAAGICLVDTVVSYVNNQNCFDNTTEAMLCAAGIAGVLMATKALEKNGLKKTLRDVLPSEMITSYFKRNPAIATLVSLLGIAYLYADQAGIPAHYIYLVLLGLKMNLFNDHKEALGYAAASSVYSLLFALSSPLIGTGQ